MSIIEKLQKINSDYKHASQVRNQARSLSLLSSGIYTEAERFVYELLQNAIDAFIDVDSDRLDIKINIIGNYFVFMHNGASFSEADIEGLCSVGNGNKAKNAKKVGYKGIGFKAVFLQSSLVYIQSGKDCCFKFDREACFNLLPEDLKAELKRDNVPLYDDVPWQIIPIEDKPPLKLNTESFNVVIYIKMSRLAELLPKIKMLLKDKEFLLFLNANHVSVSLFDNYNQISSISRAKNGEVVELAVNGVVQSRWMMHSESVAVTEEVREYISQHVSSVPEKLREADQIEVTFSVKIGDDGKFMPLQDSVVYTYLPTSYGSLGVPFLINANFLTDAGRQQLQKDSEWNKLIFREAPRLFLKWVSTLSHNHPEYYMVLPQLQARLSDGLSHIFFSSLMDAIREIAFLPSARVSDKTILVADAYIDRIGLSKVFGFERFLSCANEIFHSKYDEDCEIFDVESSILANYGVRIFESKDVLQMLMDGTVLTDITVDKNFELISFLRKQITSGEEIESLRPVAFLLDDTNRLCVAQDLSLPSGFKSQNVVANDVRTLSDSLYEKLKTTDELRWLRVNFGIKEMSNFGFVEHILMHPDYVTIDNAISVGRFVFQVWKKENYLERSDIAESFKKVLFLTNAGELKPIVNLYLGSKYRPQHDLESVAPYLGMFVSPEYPEDSDCLEDWSFFLKKCGASDSVGITQRILKAEPITDNRKEAEELKSYPILEDAAEAFYSKKHGKAIYCGYRNPIIQKRIAVSYFTFIDPLRTVNGELERYVLNIGLSQPFQREVIEDKISGKVSYWGTPMEDSLFNLVASKYKTFIEYALFEKQLFPTVMGTSLPAKDVIINSSEILHLAGRYLPVLDISNTVHESWRAVLPFKGKLTLDDYLMLLANIANDTENAKNNRERVSSIYEALISEGYSTNEKVREWGRTHKILSRSNEYLLPSDLSYITIEGFKCAVQAYGKVDRHYQDQLVDLMRTFGVRIIDKVTPEFSDPKESKGLKDRLSRNIAYIALIKSHHYKSDYDKCVEEIRQKIDNCTFYQCKRIDLSYGDNEDKISRGTYAERGRFYCVGELGPSKMELLIAPLCKYLGLGDKDRELLVVSISNTYIELDEYFKDMGYADDLLNKVKQVVATQNEPTRISGDSDSRPSVLEKPESDKQGEQAVNDSTEAPSDLKLRVDQTPGSTGNAEDAKETGKDFSQDELEQMRRVFRNDLTVEEMNDINRLDCIRLFNSLKSQGFAPRYLIGEGNEQREKEYDGSSPESLESDFINDVFDKKINHSATIETNDGRIIHVIGAINGVAHLPPRWWIRIARQTDKSLVKYVVCAIVYHKEDGFQYLQTKTDLMNAIGDRFTVVRIQSESKEDRFEKTLALFASDPECSDYSTYSLLLLHKMKNDTSYECVFTEDFREDSHGEW